MTEAAPAPSPVEKAQQTGTLGSLWAFLQPDAPAIVSEAGNRSQILQRPPLADSSEEDSLTYGLRLAGTMLMAFGAAIAILFTAFHFES